MEPRLKRRDLLFESNKPAVAQLPKPTAPALKRVARVEPHEPRERGRVPIIGTHALRGVAGVEQALDLLGVEGRRVKGLALTLMPAARRAETMLRATLDELAATAGALSH